MDSASLEFCFEFSGKQQCENYHYYNADLWKNDHLRHYEQNEMECKYAHRTRMCGFAAKPQSYKIVSVNDFDSAVFYSRKGSMKGGNAYGINEQYLFHTT